MVGTTSIRHGVSAHVDVVSSLTDRMRQMRRGERCVVLKVAVPHRGIARKAAHGGTPSWSIACDRRRLCCCFSSRIEDVEVGYEAWFKCSKSVVELSTTSRRDFWLLCMLVRGSCADCSLSETKFAAREVTRYTWS